MFGFGKKKPAPTQEKRQRTAGKTKEDYKDDLAKLGLLGIGGMDDFDIDGGGSDLDSEPDEADLENELLAMIGEDAGSTDMLIPEVKPNRQSSSIASPAVGGPGYSEESAPPSNAHIESIFNAPPPPSTIQEALDQRLAKYKAELDKATTGNEGPSKVRRIGRIVKQYEDAVTAYKKGRPVAFDELPTPPGYGAIPVAGAQTQTQPEVPPRPQPPQRLESPVPVPRPRVQEEKSQETEQSSPVKVSPAAKIRHNFEPQPTSVPSVSPEQAEINVIIGRQKQLKEAALAAKQTGDIDLAKEYLRTSKGLESMIQNLQNGVPVDMSVLPSTESVQRRLSELKARESLKDEAPIGSSGGIEQVPIQTSAQPSQPEPPVEVDPNVESIFNAPPPPNTIAEALDQRLEKYKSEVEKANETNNSGKARRMGRIVKQYEEAIAAHKRGRPVAFDELPCPPGFGPIPTGAPAAAAPAPTPASTQGQSTPSKSAPTAMSASPGQAPKISPSQGHTGSINRGANKPQTKLTLQEKQLQAILERQKKFKEAAMNAKKRGDIDQAREFLRTAKGFDKLVEASEAGLPVDMNTLPSPPEAVAALSMETSDDFEIVQSADCVPPPPGSAAEIFSKLENDLREQLKMCMSTRQHFKNMGDVASGNRFEKLAVETKKDLDTLRLSMKQNGELPKYHYENRIFSITECNSDLADDEIEINILKGVNYKVPNPTDVDTFVKAELPYPSAEEAQLNKTTVIRDTNNPDYNTTFKMKINRTARPFQRFIHRHGVKLEVWSKGGFWYGFKKLILCRSGFLRSSTLIGTATVKLLPLETKCTLHDAFDILEGRRPVGKIEVKVRLREPVLTKQITQKKEKWLTIDRV